MFIVPLYTIADRNDDMAQLSAQTITSEFVDQIIRLGKITAKDYSQYLMSLGSTGNTYDVQIELKILDENPAIQKVDSNKETQGENLYYSLYTSQIEEIFTNKVNEENEDPEILLKEGDVISVVAKNDSKTVSQALKSIYYTIAGEDLYIISSTASGTVAVNGIR